MDWWKKPAAEPDRPLTAFSGRLSAVPSDAVGLPCARSLRPLAAVLREGVFSAGSGPVPSPSLKPPATRCSAAFRTVPSGARRRPGRQPAARAPVATATRLIPLPDHHGFAPERTAVAGAFARRDDPVRRGAVNRADGRRAHLRRASGERRVLRNQHRLGRGAALRQPVRPHRVLRRDRAGDHRRWIAARDDRGVHRRRIVDGDVLALRWRVAPSRRAAPMGPLLCRPHPHHPRLCGRGPPPGGHAGWHQPRDPAVRLRFRPDRGSVDRRPVRTQVRVPLSRTRLLPRAAVRARPPARTSRAARAPAPIAPKTPRARLAVLCRRVRGRWRLRDDDHDHPRRPRVPRGGDPRRRHRSVAPAGGRGGVRSHRRLARRPAGHRSGALRRDGVDPWRVSPPSGSAGSTPARERSLSDGRRSRRSARRPWQSEVRPST